MSAPTDQDAIYLRRVIANAQRSRDAGRHPFASLVVLEGEVARIVLPGEPGY